MGLKISQNSHNVVILRHYPCYSFETEKIIGNKNRICQWATLTGVSGNPSLAERPALGYCTRPSLATPLSCLLYPRIHLQTTLTDHSRHLLRR